MKPPRVEHVSLERLMHSLQYREEIYRNLPTTKFPVNILRQIRNRLLYIELTLT